MPYTVSEIFCALQGEGVRAGTRNVFIRFAGCNLKCVEEEHGFDCDTDFASIYKRYSTAEELVAEVQEAWGKAKKGKAVILTGGEPTLQLDLELTVALRNADFYIAMETNGIKELPGLVENDIDWISCSPKTAEHTLQRRSANELRYVRSIRQGIPKPKVKASHLYLSPGADSGGPTQENLNWCMQLIDENPTWKLSVQMHKLWGVR